jgi:hypothetical protein
MHTIVAPYVKRGDTDRSATVFGLGLVKPQKHPQRLDFRRLSPRERALIAFAIMGEGGHRPCLMH